MELNFIEKYFIDRLESLEKENAELKEKLKAAPTAKTAQDGASDPSGAPALGMLYHVTSFPWHINAGNLANFKRALSKKNFTWLSNNCYNIIPYFWNYEIKVGDNTILLNITDSLDVQVVKRREEMSFETLSAAQDKLLEMVSKDIKEFEKKHVVKKNA